MKWIFYFLHSNRLFSNSCFYPSQNEVYDSAINCDTLLRLGYQNADRGNRH